MSDYKTIERALLGVNQATLQDIVFQIINKKYASVNTVNLGSASGVQTTRKGTPDMFVQLPNGDYIFVEVTIQKTELLNKIKSDIAKCKENALKLRSKDANVIKVIFACLGKLETSEIQECQNLCKEFCLDSTTPFEFWGLDKLSTLLLQNYQEVAVSELNIHFSYGFIKTLEDCLQEDLYDVSQRHEFLYREEELKDIEYKLFEKNMVLLYGSAGCGKTRLCIHLAQKLKQDGKIKEAYFIKHVFNNGLESLCNFSGQEPIAIILDDINRLPFIKEFIYYIQSNKNIYVFATVRDYALNTIINDLKINHYDNLLYAISISPLKKEQQESIIKKIIPKASYDTVEAIFSVAHENLRFAVMMAETLKKHGYLPTKIKELMEQHFVCINSDLKNAINADNNSSYLKSLALLAFFHRIVICDDDYNNWSTISAALNELGIPFDIFQDAMAYWDRKEVVNISFESKVYEIGDQILASYLFYKLVFEEKQIALCEMFELFFPRYRRCFIDMFNSILPAYGYDDDAIMQPLTQLWNDNYKIKNNSESVQFISTFFGLLPVETLDFIKMQGLPLKEDFVDILCGFESSKFYQIAIDILLAHIENGQFKSDISEKIIEAFSIHRHSFDNALVAQKYLLSKLREKLLNNDTFKTIFLELSKKLLNLSFHSTEMHNNSMTCFTFEAAPYACLLEVRTIIWEGLIALYKGEQYKELNKLLTNFRYLPNSRNIEKLGEIFDNDKNTILTFVREETKKQLTFEQKITIKYFLEDCCSDDDSDFQEQLHVLEGTSVDFKIYSDVFSRKREERIDWRLRESKYDKILKAINLPEDYYSYLSSLEAIGAEDNTISAAVDAFFKFIDAHDSVHFVQYLKQFILKFKDLNISYATISYILASKYDLREIIYFVQSSSIKNKGLALLELLQNLKRQEITSELYDLCIITFEKEYCTYDIATPRLLQLSSFMEYEKFQAGFILKIFQTIQSSKNKNSDKYRLIEDFYNCFGEEKWSYCELSIERIEKYFGDKLKSVYYEMFFVLLQSNLLHISGEFVCHIASKNIEYLYRYYDLYFLRDDEFTMSDYLDIDVLRKFPNIARNMLAVYERCKNVSGFWFSFYNLDTIMAKNFDERSFLEFSELFVERYLTEETDLNNMANCVSSLKSDWQIIYVKTLIAKDIGTEIFKKLSIFGLPSSWSGSDVAVYEKIIKTIDIFLQEIKLTTQNISYVSNIKMRRAKLVEYQKRARLRELSDYRFFS